MTDREAVLLECVHELRRQNDELRDELDGLRARAPMVYIAVPEPAGAATDGVPHPT